MKHKNIIKTAGAVVSGLLVLNLLSAAIYTLPAKYSVEGKATPEVWEQNSLACHRKRVLSWQQVKPWNLPPSVLRLPRRTIPLPTTFSLLPKPEPAPRAEESDARSTSLVDMAESSEPIGILYIV